MVPGPAVKRGLGQTVLTLELCELGPDFGLVQGSKRKLHEVSSFGRQVVKRIGAECLAPEFRYACG